MRRTLSLLLLLLVHAGYATTATADDNEIHLAGIVLDPAGKPLASVAVFAYRDTTLYAYGFRTTVDPTVDLPEPDASGETGADGRFRFVAKAAGLYGLRLDHPSLARAVVGGVPAARGNVPKVVVKTVAATTIEGTLVDSSGRRVAGARVRLGAGFGFTDRATEQSTLRTFVVRSDELGHWAIPRVPPLAPMEGQVWVRPDSASPVWYGWYPPVAARGSEPSVVGGPASVHLRLVDQKGQSVVGRIRGDVRIERRGAAFVVDTGPDGTAIVGGLPEGKMSPPIAASATMVSARREPMVADKATIQLVAGGRAECEIVMEPAETVDGNVVDDEGKPISGAFLRSRSPELTYPSAVSDRTGGFRLGNVRLEDTVFAIADGYIFDVYRYLDRLNVKPSSSGLVVPMLRTGEVAGQVFTPDGSPAIGWTVASLEFVEALNGAMNSTITGEDGRFLLPTTPVGTYFFVAAVRNGIGEARATVVAGKRTEGIVIRTKAR